MMCSCSKRLHFLHSRLNYVYKLAGAGGGKTNRRNDLKDSLVIRNTNIEKSERHNNFVCTVYMYIIARI